GTRPRRRANPRGPSLKRPCAQAERGKPNVDWVVRAVGPACEYAALRTSAGSRRGGAAAPAPALRAMDRAQPDREPPPALAEAEEQPLPESEQDIDLAAAAGPLAVGRAVIANHAKLAPSSPGVYRMIDAKGDVLYVGKAKNIRKRIIAYGRPTGYDPRIERMI